MSPSDELRRLVALLQKTLRRAGLTQRQVSVRLGQHPSYLSQVFAGKARLKEDLVFRVLKLCGVEVEDFYAELAAGGRPSGAGERVHGPGQEPSAAAAQRPAAGRSEAGMRAGRASQLGSPAPGPVTAAEARRFIREALAARQPARPERQPKRPVKGARRREQIEATRHSARVKELLRLKIRRAGLLQRDISRRLGEHPDYLSQVLRGNVVLKAEHVLAVLGELEITPAAFYGELYAGVPQVTAVADPARELVRGVTWGEILALIDSELEASARRRAAAAAPRAAERPAPAHVAKRPARKARSGVARRGAA